jgi:Uma2 family endonuclease
MAEAARRRLSLQDWIAYEGEPDVRYELFGGTLVAMSPPSHRHGLIANNVGRVIDDAVAERPPCHAVQGAGLEVVVDGEERGYVADVLMTCEEPDDEATIDEPRLIVEVLSPTTKGIDKRRKVPDYGRLPTVGEIWLVDSRMRAVLVWRRIEGTWVGSFPYTGEDAFDSPALGCRVELDRLYRSTGL